MQQMVEGLARFGVPIVKIPLPVLESFEQVLHPVLPRTPQSKSLCTFDSGMLGYAAMLYDNIRGALTQADTSMVAAVSAQYQCFIYSFSYSEAYSPQDISCKCKALQMRLVSFTAGQRALTDFPGGFDLQDSSDVRILFLLFCSSKENEWQKFVFWQLNHWPALFLRIQLRKVARVLPLGA